MIHIKTNNYFPCNLCPWTNKRFTWIEIRLIKQSTCRYNHGTYTCWIFNMSWRYHDIWEKKQRKFFGGLNSLQKHYKWCIIKLSTNVVNRIPFSKLKKSTINLKFMKCPKYWERTTKWSHSYTLPLSVIWNLQMKNLVTILIVNIIQIWESWYKVFLEIQ